MSDHLSTEEKALFKAEIDLIRRRIMLFIEVLEANKEVQKNRETIVLDGMVVYEALQVSFDSLRTVSIQS
jgi:rRNA pseudouridine-1189 N-methylase Emg1 (Nep1/Mra1 family)